MCARLFALTLAWALAAPAGALAATAQPESPPAESALWRDAEHAAASAGGLPVHASTPSVRVGEPVVISVEVPRPGYLNIVDIGPDGVATILFPNPREPDNRVSAGTLTVPSPQLRTHLRITPPFGPNLVAAFLSPEPLDFAALGVTAGLQTIAAQLAAATRAPPAGADAQPQAVAEVARVPPIGGTVEVLTCDASGPCGIDDIEVGDRPDLMAAGIFLDPEVRGLPSDFGPVRAVYAKGLAVTQAAEGFVAHLYNDASHFCTVAYGHLVVPAPCNGQEPEAFRRGLTPEQGNGLLATDMIRAERAVLALVQVPLSDGQYAALCDFTYNVGARHLRTSALLKAVNTMDLASVEAQFMRWIMAGGKVRQGLVDRRRSELALFFEGLPRTRGLEPGALPEPPLDIRAGEAGE